MNQTISKRINVCEDNIGLDGIKFRGKSPVYSETGFWHREPGDEIELWKNSNFKLLELTKDLNDDEVWDIRAETGLKNHINTPVIGNRWYRNLMTFEYLLFSMFVKGEIPAFDSLADDKLISSFNSVTSARINCKKTAGGGECPRSILNYHIKAYGDLIRRQICELKPTLIYIGGCDGNIILDKIVRPIYIDLHPAESSGWIYISETAQVVVINGFNPGMRRSLEEVYVELSSALKSFATTTNYSNYITFNALKYLKP